MSRELCVCKGRGKTTRARHGWHRGAGQSPQYYKEGGSGFRETQARKSFDLMDQRARGLGQGRPKSEGHL